MSNCTVFKEFNIGNMREDLLFIYFLYAYKRVLNNIIYVMNVVNLSYLIDNIILSA